MNPDKQIIITGLLERVNASPFLIVIDYTGLKVKQFTELRNRLFGIGASCVVAKNSYMRKVLSEAGLPDIGSDLTGQTAFVTGDSEVFAAAKTIKNFEKEFKKPEMRVGILGNAVLDTAKLKAIADIPSREAVLAQLLRTINEPATRIARVLKNKFIPDADPEAEAATDDAAEVPAAAPAAEGGAEPVAATAEAVAEPAAETPAEPAAPAAEASAESAEPPASSPE